MLKPALAVAITLCALVGPAGLALAEAPPPIVLAKLEVKPRRGKAPRAEYWVRRGLPGLYGRIDAECFQPALQQRPKLTGKLVLRFKLGGDHVLRSVKADADRFKLPSFRACVVKVVAATVHGIPPDPPYDPDLPGAYVETDRTPPPAVALPLSVALHLVFTAPPVPVASPTPTPSPAPGKDRCKNNPAGCKSKGCPSGMVCDTKQSCIPSSCGCDSATGNWTCTADCGGGMCVPAGSTGRPPNPKTPPLPPG
ncbi:MAG: hypothetical protein IT370_22605 [Deltaproteobacteria bacterium]|nr:hypothetical protein [Deltaproteobacteria bacterium]